MPNNHIVTDRDELCLIFELCSDLLGSGARLSISFAAIPPNSDLTAEEEAIILDAFHNNLGPAREQPDDLESWAREVREEDSN